MIEHFGSWLFWTGVPALGIGALVVLWSLGWDAIRRGRSRMRRCPRCWYDMTGTPGLRCPECGKEAQGERSLLKRRRRWRWAAPGLIMAGAGAFGVSPRLQQINWLHVLPNWALLWSLEEPCPGRPAYRGAPSFAQVAPNFRQLLADEVWRRAALGHLSDGQYASLAAKQMRSIDGPLKIRTRARWPRGEHVFVQVERRFAGVRPRELRISFRTVEPREILLRDDTDMAQWLSPDARWGPMEPGNFLPETPPSLERELFDVGIPDPGSTELACDAVVLELGKEVYRGVVRVPIDVSASVDALMSPASDPEFDRSLRAAIRSGLYLLPEQDFVVLTRPEIPTEVAVTAAIHIAVKNGEQVVAQSTVIMSLQPPADPSSRGWDYQPPESQLWRALVGDLGRLHAANPTDPAWTVIVRGDPVLALHDFDSKTYWEGQETLPLSQVVREPPQPAPNPRRW